jgi:glutamate carboxypeptidase
VSRGAVWTARVLNALAVLQPAKCGSAVILSVLLALAPIGIAAQSNDAVRAQAQREKQPLLDTLKALVEIESGSADIEGVTRIGTLIAERLRGLGGRVELVPPAADRPRITGMPQQFADTVVGRFHGRGSARILLLAHMDTVYARGMLAQQPFRVDGDRAYGLGIADDKHGIAVILHGLTMLKALGVDGYGVITVVMSPDEEVGSLAERDLLTKLGAEHDVVLSFEGPGQDESIRMATSGIQLAVLTVTGRASHAGNAPEQGRNALYELSHQLLQLRDLSEPTRGVKLNWTLANAGSVVNTIPAAATAMGDMRANDPDDFKAVEAAIRERIKNRLIPDTTVDVRFETLFPPMPFAPASLPLAEHVQRLYAEAGGTAKINRVSIGAGTDAAFAALETKAPVIEGMGLRNFGAHSSNAEYVNISSIEPRLYLLTRLIMDIAAGKAGQQLAK